MWEDAASNSLLLCVMDGHGEFGDKVSQDLKKNWPPLLYVAPRHATPRHATPRHTTPSHADALRLALLPPPLLPLLLPVPHPSRTHLHTNAQLVPSAASATRTL